MKFILISPKNRTVYNFRGQLIKDIQDNGYEVIVTGPDNTDIERINELGVKFVQISSNKNGTSISQDIRYCKDLYRLFKQEQPDAIMGYTSKPVIFGSIAAWKAGVKNINCLITGGGYTFTAKTVKARVLGVIVRMLYRIALKRSNRVIFQNKDDRDEFIHRRLVDSSKCHVVHGSGVDMDYFTPAEYPDRITFFMLSRLLKSKGVVEYLEAAKIVKAEHPEVRFTLLGKYEDKMQDAVDKAYIEDMISKGIVERYEETNDVRPYYAECSVYVLPSYWEGTPRTVLEAMAMGRPIITTDANGCRDTVIDGKNGYKVPHKDVIALADRMRYFIEHPKDIEQQGRASVEYCRDMFDVKLVNKDMLNNMHII